MSIERTSDVEQTPVLPEENNKFDLSDSDEIAAQLASEEGFDIEEAPTSNEAVVEAEVDDPLLDEEPDSAELLTQVEVAEDLDDPLLDEELDSVEFLTQAEVTEDLDDPRFDVEVESEDTFIPSEDVVDADDPLTDVEREPVEAPSENIIPEADPPPAEAVERELSEADNDRNPSTESRTLSLESGVELHEEESAQESVHNQVGATDQVARLRVTEAVHDQDEAPFEPTQPTTAPENNAAPVEEVSEPVNEQPGVPDEALVARQADATLAENGADSDVQTSAGVQEDAHHDKAGASDQATRLRDADGVSDAGEAQPELERSIAVPDSSPSVSKTAEPVIGPSEEPEESFSEKQSGISSHEKRVDQESPLPVDTQEAQREKELHYAAEASDRTTEVRDTSVFNSSDIGDETPNPPEKEKPPFDFETVKEETFITNGGEEISFGEAVDEITQRASDYMDALNESRPADERISDVKKEEVLADIKETLIAQEGESRARGLGDHGIRHIYGNYERGERYLDSNPNATAEDKLAVLVSHTYHDMGYTMKNELVNNSGTLNGGSDKLHDVASMRYWTEEKAELYDGIFSAGTKGIISEAIGTHNIGEKDTGRDGLREGEVGKDAIERNTSRDANIIVSTVHITDKLALSEREKFSELLRSDPKLVELTEGMNAMTGAFERMGLCDEKGRATGQGEALLTAYHDAIKTYIDSKGYDEAYAFALKDAVDKDVGFNSGKFSSKMNYIYTPSDCYQYNPETGRNEITVYVIDYPDATTTDIANKQVAKLLEDLGLPDDKAKEAAANGGYDFGEDRGLAVKVEHINADAVPENADLIEVHESIEVGRQEFQNLKEDLEKILKLRGDDATYEDYEDAHRFADGVPICSKAEFDACSVEERRELFTAIAADIVLAKVSDILSKEEYK